MHTYMSRDMYLHTLHTVRKNYTMNPSPPLPSLLLPFLPPPLV